MTRFLFFLGLVCLASTSTFSANPIKNYTFKDQSGKSVQLNDFKGHYLFVSFVYTRCPIAKMCPLTMTLNKQVFKIWQQKSPSIPLKFLVVTLDPVNDTPSVMNSFGARYGLDTKSFLLITGEEQTISDFCAEFNALGFPSNGLISHNSRSVLVGPDLVPLKDYNENEWKPETVIKDLLDFASKTHKKS